MFILFPDMNIKWHVNTTGMSKIKLQRVMRCEKLNLTEPFMPVMKLIKIQFFI